MALGASSLRVAYANLYSNLGDKLDDVKINKSKQIKDYENKSMYHFDYYVCDAAYDFLVGKGVPLSMHCYRPHPHPISKMIENHILINVFGSYLRNKNCFISLKENKISLVNHRSSAGKDITKNVSLFNRLVHAKDALRYTNAVRTPEISLSEKLKGQLNASDIVFIHDEVHYWSLSDFQRFLGVCDKDVVYSVIYPAEINDGQTISLNPLLYKFRKSECGTHFTWAPDGSYNGAYVQPINPWLLTTSRTVDTKFRTWTVSKLESIGAHHVFVCTLGSKVTEDEYTYCDYTLLDPRKFSDSSLRMPELRAELVRKTAHYLMALKKPDAASAVSKLRQLTKGDETADEILFLGKLARTVSSTKYFEENGLYRFGKSLRQTFKRCFGRWSAYMLDKDDYDKLNLQTILKGLCSTEIRIGRKFRDLVITREMMKLQGLHEAMDMMFYGVDSVISSNECKVVPDREAQPYSHNLYAELYRYDDPVIQLKKFKEVIGQNVPKSYESKVYYCEGAPLQLFGQLISPEGTNLYRTCLSITTARDIDLLKDKLITREEYERRATRSSAQVPTKEIGLEHLDMDAEADQGWDEAIGQVVSIGKNTCALGPIQRVMDVGVEYVLSELNSLDINFSRYVSEKGITLVGLMECGRLLKLTYAVHTKHGAIHCSGERKPFAIELIGDHAKEVQYVPFENNAHNALRMSDGCGLAQVHIKSAYAQKVRDSFQKEFTGVMLSDLEKTLPNFSGFQDAWVKVYTFFGFAGSGKSSYVTKICGLLPNLKIEVVSPRRLLKDEWEKWLGKGKGMAHTFENYILKGMMQPDMLIVDEVSLFPPGYIDLIYFMKKPKHLVLLGDPLQTSYYSKDDNLFLSPIEADVFQRVCEIPGEDASIPYLIYTHRLPEKQGLFEVHSDGPGELKVVEVNKLDKKLTTLCFKRIKEGDYNGFREVLTVGQGQGMSRDVVQLVMDNGCLYSDDRTLITALTRARKEIRVHYMVDKNSVLNGAKSHMMRSFCAGERISLDRLLRALKSSLKVEPKLLRSEVYIGNGEVDAESRLDGDPYLKAMLKLLQAEEMEEEEMEKELVPGHSKTHLPLSSFSNELFATELNAKEMREAFSDDFGYSNQITDITENKRFGAPWSHAAIYLNHKSDDDLTFMMTIKKRLRFCDYERNKANYLKKNGTGRQMFEILKRKLDLDNFVPHVEIEEKEREFMEKRIAKSQALLEKHSVRSDPDWPSNILKVFIKNQTCTKMEKRGIDAKAGQSIACFSHAVLCKFGPQLRKTENEFRSLLPGNIMIFSQKNFDDLDKWCKEYFNDFSGTDSDYEAFDRSQDATILGLEVSLLEHFRWPFELIEEYKELKLMMGCTLGDLAIMRFSGEFGTFFFNTVCNMAFTYMRYDIDKHYPVAFAGDDMVAPGRLRVLSCYDNLLDKLELKAKVNYGNSPLFCGWRVSPLGIVKDPNLLLDRWEIAVEKHNLDDCMCNYALEASYGYKLSDSLYELNIDIDSYQELIRKIIKVKRKLPKAISDIFSPDEDVYSSSEE